MFIELAEVLRCPHGHEGKHYCVLLPQAMDDRDVRTGEVACPVCRATYPIVDGVADLRLPDDRVPPPPCSDAALPPVDDVAALLSVRGPGGYVVLVGSAAHLAEELAVRHEGVHLVLVNGPDGIGAAPTHSQLLGGQTLPLATAVARGVVIGSEHAMEPWVTEGARLLLRGLRMVVLREGVEAPGVSMLASGQGMTLGVRE